jgi:uncharacterized membrane protein YfcA
VVRGWALFILLGVGLGMLVANLVSGALLKTLFGGLLILVAVYMLYTARHTAPQLADRLPGRGPQALLAGVMGSFSALLGIGGGTLAVPMLNLFAFPMHRAVGTASVFGFLISVPATLGYILTGWGAAGLPPASTGFVNWLSFAALVPATMLFAPVGVRLCHRLDVRQLKRVFAMFLLLVGAKMAVL